MDQKNLLIASVFLLIIILENGGCVYINSQLDKISLEDGTFVDPFGRTRLFHGANFVQKSFPWYPYGGTYDLTNETQLDNLKAWGFNAVRLGVMWAGIIPEKDTINQTYLNVIIDIIKNLEQRGIYTIVDLHQDYMSTKFGSYDGVPRWLVDLMPDSPHPYPWPFSNDSTSFPPYFTEACGYGFQNFYDNVNNFQDYFGQYWSLVSKSLANYSSVLGYEFINEPFAGDVYSEPSLLLPGIAGKKHLMPLYDNIYNIIRANDNNTLVFYEPITYAIAFNGSVLGTGFDRAPANDSDRTVFSWHYYCLFLQSGNPLKNNTYPVSDRVLCDEIQLKQSFKAIKDDQEVLGSGVFLTEFGVCGYAKSNGSLDTTECEYILDASDENFMSWTYWDSNFYHDDGSIQDDIITKFCRVYPQATSGKPIHLYYNATSRVFIYEFEPDSTIVAPTEIVVPAYLYPNGFNVTVSDQLKWTFDQQNNILMVTLTDKISDSTNAKVIIEYSD